MFPRVELCLQDPDQNLLSLDTTVFDSQCLSLRLVDGISLNWWLLAGYMTKVSQLQMILTLAQQLNCDVQNCPSHKYLAHQTALLYVGLYSVKHHCLVL